MELLVKSLAHARNITSEYEVDLARLKADISAEFGAKLEICTERINGAKEAEAEIYGLLREAGVKVYQDTGNKNPHAAVSVGEYTIYNYETKDALEWLIEKNIPKALKVDARQFKKIVDVLSPPFVEIAKEARAKVARDLDKYLEV